MKRAQNPDDGTITQVPDKEFATYIYKLGWIDVDAVGAEAPAESESEPAPAPRRRRRSRMQAPSE